MIRNQQHKTTFLPDFCAVRAVFVVVLIAELLALVLSLAGSNLAWLDDISDFALKSLFIQWAAICSVAVLCVSRNFLNRQSDHWAATWSYILVLLICFLVSEGAWLITRSYPQIHHLIRESHAVFLLRSLGISSIVAALALRYFYVRHQWRRQIESEANARFEALQARIRPHFLFNCMNTIASLTRSEPALAEQAIEDLSGIFRITLQHAHQITTLSEELDLCNRYLNIESHRLGNRLKVNWSIDSIPKEAQLPALTLQPIIENAIYHGIESQPGTGTINISGQIVDNLITLHFDNPVPGIKLNDHHAGNQLAQENTTLRLQAVFGDEGKFVSWEKDNRYHVLITMPFIHENTDRR